ncbi:MAG TPA: hypothetical protein VN193_04795 [Candidatus Angelobacter sp.]|nr:hypothetical protein [Candidatus Angelobacter sp.]
MRDIDIDTIRDDALLGMADGPVPAAARRRDASPTPPRERSALVTALLLRSLRPCLDDTPDLQSSD